MAGLDPVALIKYPVELTDKDWQKKKGVIAKTVKTGLKAELDKGEALHKKIDTSFLSPSRDSPKTMDDLEKGLKEAKKYYASHVEPLRDQLRAIAKAAKEASTKLSKKNFKDAAKAADAIATTADHFAVTCKSITWQDQYDEMRKRIQFRIDHAAKELKPSIAKFRNGTKAYLSSEQTNHDWDDHVKQDGRSVSNSISVLDGYKTEFWPKFKLFQGFDTATLKLTDNDPPTKEKRRKIIQAALKLVNEIEKYTPK